MAGTFDDIIRSVIGAPPEPIATMESPWLKVPPDKMYDSPHMLVPPPGPPRRESKPILDDIMGTFDVFAKRRAVKNDADAMMEAIMRRQRLGRSEE
jgi:hypothetical protein